MMEKLTLLSQKLSQSTKEPFQGDVKYKDDISQELLTSFAIAGGSVTETTDFDGGGLKDYGEVWKSKKYVNRLSTAP
jgi:hypothetical protein